ncbi:hypothetical protein COO03_23530, partial [Bacillus sp. AFS098217]|uniref:hypothetical protein n=1 Tax=Bacillus sp. AFS098217 TaxID=2033868 RepID=UPI000BECA5DF
ARCSPPPKNKKKAFLCHRLKPFNKFIIKFSPLKVASYLHIVIKLVCGRKYVKSRYNSLLRIRRIKERNEVKIQKTRQGKWRDELNVKDN